ncbi:unnamed protein product, partial [Laminaria digitata]
EFEFESQTSVGEEMCVSICVPGVLKDKADLQRGWGVEPRGEDVSARERLRRFYYVYNRDKVEDVDDILDAYDGQESKLCKALYARYRADPRDPPTREALANAEGRTVEGVSKEDIKRDAEAIGQLMEAVLTQEKEEKEKAKAASKVAAKYAAAKRHPEPAPSKPLSPPRSSNTRGQYSASPLPSDAFGGKIGAENATPGGKKSPSRFSSDTRLHPLSSPPSRKASVGKVGAETSTAAVESRSSSDTRGHPLSSPPSGKASVGTAGVETATAAVESLSWSDADLDDPLTAAALTELVWGKPPPTASSSAGATAAASPPQQPSSSSAAAAVTVTATAATTTAAATSATATAVTAPVTATAAATAAETNTAAVVRGFPVTNTAAASNEYPSGDGVLLRDWDRSGGDDAERETIDIFEEGGDVAAEDEGKKDKDPSKHRVWFWQDALPHTDQYILRWESDWLVELGKSVESMIKSISQSAMQETLKYTTLATIMASLSWPLALLTLTSMIDADWTIGRERADVAGKILADALLNREQGCRPVTLVGTSLGARLIFSCLEEIARRHELWEEQMLESGAAGGKNGPVDASGRSKMTRLKRVVTPDNKGKSKVGLHGVGVSASSSDGG